MINRFGFDPVLDFSPKPRSSRVAYWVGVITKALVAAFIAWLVVGTLLSL